MNQLEIRNPDRIAHIWSLAAPGVMRGGYCMAPSGKRSLIDKASGNPRKSKYRIAKWRAKEKRRRQANRLRRSKS